MDLIKSYLTTVTIYVLITTIIQNMLPASKTKTSVCMVLSLVLAVTIITPVLKININNPDISAYISEYTINDTSIEDIKSRQNQSTKAIIESAVKRQVADILQKHGLHTSSTVIINDNFMIESVTVDELSTEASKEISEFFGISEDFVNVRR